MNQLKTWSHSRLSTFESCNYRAKLQYIDKIPEPDRPLPEGKTEHANDRGTRLHTAAEMYTKGGVELAPEIAKNFTTEHEKLRELFAEGRVSLEGDWGFNKAWEPVAWMSSDVWCRVKCDAVAHLTKKHAVVIDFKSGKRWGNEMKHTEQMHIYTLSTLLKYPQLDKVTTELWYWDANELSSMTYTRDQGLRFVTGFEKRADLLTACLDFKPNPNVFSCKWCAYRPIAKGGSGHCKSGV